MTRALAACAITLWTMTLVVSEASREPAVAAYAEGAPPGFSGGFGEQSCHACHFHLDLDSGPGRLTITDLPERFTGGERYPLTVTLTRPGMKLGGFQLTARFKDGGAQAGTLAPAAGDAKRLAVESQASVQYVGQRHAGAAPVTADSLEWSVVWTAPPAASGPVLFHLAANAADGDGTAEGDAVHTLAIEVLPARIP